MGIAKKEFGITKDGKQTYLYTLRNANGMEAVVTDFGAILVNLFVPNKDGKVDDIVLGYDTLAEYEVNDCFFGATIGRNANRIAGAKFSLDGQTYHLVENENGNNLHSEHDKGFHKVVWNTELDEAVNTVKFSYLSPDGENGFPGNVQISVSYTLSEDNALSLTYDGVSDKKTTLNLTNHTYFNLGGHAAGSICDEKMTIVASRYTEILPGAIPTGKLPSVEGTPMDFRTPRRIGDEIDKDWEQLTLVQGYDHNWALDTTFGKVEKIVELQDEKAGRIMEVYTDLPGVQFYAGNVITNHTGKSGVIYDKRHALCLETQYFPNSINEPVFRQPIFEAGQPYHTVTIYKFV